MPLGTIDRTPPPFFRQGPSALSKLALFGILSVFLMVADMRFGLAPPLRAVMAAALYPVQWLVQQPIRLARELGDASDGIRALQVERADLRARLTAQSLRAVQVEQLAQENERLRGLLALRARLTPPAHTAQVLYDAGDPFSRKVVIDRGMVDGIAAGSPVLDELGVLGQVTRAHPSRSEVTLVSDRDLAVPVLNTRTGARGVAFGDSVSGGMELRFAAGNADVQVGDLLTTSGVDGVYPPGLPVARVEKVDRRSDSAFARITLRPLAQVHGAVHVLVVQPLPLAAELPAAAASAAEPGEAHARRARR